MELNSIFIYVFYGTVAVFIPVIILVVVYSMIDNARKPSDSAAGLYYHNVNPVVRDNEFSHTGVIHINEENGKIMSGYNLRYNNAYQSADYNYTYQENEGIDHNTQYDSFNYHESTGYLYHDESELELTYFPEENKYNEFKPSVLNRPDKYSFRANFTLNYKG